MSDAQAAQVTENGVPPAAHEYDIEEAPPFKVSISFSYPFFFKNTHFPIIM
jgi:hypothetical protein